VRPLHLTPRLLAVASFIRPTDRVLDIGTDHARLPVYLAERGLCASVTAADIAEGPLARALRTVKTHRLEDKVPLILCNGAEGLNPGDYDTVTITGMGGDTIMGIIQRSPWLLEKRLILQPQTKKERFGTAAKSVSEGRRQYHIFVMGR
jgi:tRNA (adenine22-N1)-methyltransferase